MLKLLAAGTLCWTAFAFAQPSKPKDELKYAVIVTRHGVRSPTWELSRLNQYSDAPWPSWGVPPGDLTAHGAELIKLMGGYYRAYFSDLGLLGKPDCKDASATYFWADIDQRTLATANSLASTLVPGCVADVHSVAPAKADPLFDPIDAGLVKQDQPLAMAAVKGRIGSDPNAIVGANRAAFDQLIYVLQGNGRAAMSIFAEPTALQTGKDQIDMSGPLRLASTLTENFLLEYTNGMSGSELGWGRLTANNLQQIMALHTAYAGYMRQTPYIARVRGSNLLSHVVKSIQQAVVGAPVKGSLGKPGTKLLIISGHDTNISNLSGMLGLSWLLPSYQPNDVPPGGALVFSLWRSSEGRFSVSLQVISQSLDQMHDGTQLSLAAPPVMADLFIPGCGTAGAGYPCSWTAFNRVATETIFSQYVK